jgi:hypothetical protein
MDENLDINFVEDFDSDWLLVDFLEEDIKKNKEKNIPNISSFTTNVNDFEFNNYYVQNQEKNNFSFINSSENNEQFSTFNNNVPKTSLPKIIQPIKPLTKKIQNETEVNKKRTIDMVEKIVVEKSKKIKTENEENEQEEKEIILPEIKYNGDIFDFGENTFIIGPSHKIYIEFKETINIIKYNSEPNNVMNEKKSEVNQIFIEIPKNRAKVSEVTVEVQYTTLSSPQNIQYFTSKIYYLVNSKQNPERLTKSILKFKSYKNTNDMISQLIFSLFQKKTKIKSQKLLSNSDINFIKSIFQINENISDLSENDSKEQIESVLNWFYKWVNGFNIFMSVKSIKLLWENDLIKFDNWINIVSSLKQDEVKIFWTKSYPGSLIIASLNENNELINYRLVNFNIIEGVIFILKKVRLLKPQ